MPFNYGEEAEELLRGPRVVRAPFSDANSGNGPTTPQQEVEFAVAPAYARTQTNYNVTTHTVDTGIATSPNNTTATNNSSTLTNFVANTCSICHVGVFKDTFTCCGLCWGILSFPIGRLCCLALTEKKCDRCGASKPNDMLWEVLNLVGGIFLFGDFLFVFCLTVFET